MKQGICLTWLNAQKSCRMHPCRSVFENTPGNMDMWQLFILCNGSETTVRLQAFLLLVQIRCTVRTFYCVDVDLGLAERAGLGGRSRFVQLVDAFDHQEDDESR